MTREEKLRDLKRMSRAINLCIFSLFLCVALLAGTTYAFFTDTQTVKNNKIKAGTLDVQLWQFVDTNNDGEKDDFIDISISDDKVFDYNKWEPGYSVGETFRVKNNGNLNLSYSFTFGNISKVSREIDDVIYDLGDVLDVYAVTGAAVTNNLYKADRSFMTDSNYIGTFNEIVRGEKKIIKDSSICFLEGRNDNTPVSSEPIAIIITMKTSAGNEYQETALDFDIILRASQGTGEIDGFGSSDYDKDATNTDLIIIDKDSISGQVLENSNTVLEINDEKRQLIKVTVPSGINNADVGDTLYLSIDRVTGTDIIVDSNTISFGYEISLHNQDNEKVSDTDGNIVVKLYIGEGLNNVVIYHNGDEIQNVNYDSSTGYAVFKTDSFSPYTVTCESPIAVATVNGKINNYYISDFIDILADAKNNIDTSWNAEYLAFSTILAENSIDKISSDDIKIVLNRDLELTGSYGLTVSKNMNADETATNIPTINLNMNGHSILITGTDLEAKTEDAGIMVYNANLNILDLSEEKASTISSDFRQTILSAGNSLVKSQDVNLISTYISNNVRGFGILNGNVGNLPMGTIEISEGQYSTVDSQVVSYNGYLSKGCLSETLDQYTIKVTKKEYIA